MTMYIIERDYCGQNSYTNVLDCTEAQVKNFCDHTRAAADFDGVRDWIGYYTLESWIESHKAKDDFIEKVINCPPPPKKGIWWLALDEATRMRIVQLGGVNYPIMGVIKDLNEIKHYHVTLDYDVTYVGNPYCAWLVDEDDTSFSILVKGLAYNDKAACLVVELKGIESCNCRPHITLATAEGVPPVYSNKMLAGDDGAYSFLPLDIELEGQLEFFEFK